MVEAVKNRSAAKAKGKGSAKAAKGHVPGVPQAGRVRRHHCERAGSRPEVIAEALALAAVRAEIDEGGRAAS